MTYIKPNDEWRVDGGALSGIHNTRTCNCEQCRHADEYERRKLLWADAATVRAALMDVIDEGCRAGRPVAGRYRCTPWTLNDKDEDYANAQRDRFADAVLHRLVELQSPPHDYPQLHLLCDRHKRARLAAHAGECRDCARERVR